MDAVRRIKSLPNIEGNYEKVNLYFQWHLLSLLSGKYHDPCVDIATTHSVVYYLSDLQSNKINNYIAIVKKKN